MDPLFLALGNKSGIACAASADHLIHELSRKDKIVLAVRPSPLIPWAEIMDGYRACPSDGACSTVAEYARDFGRYLAEGPFSRQIRAEETPLLFLGYGRDEVFPSALKTAFGPLEDGSWGLMRAEAERVSHKKGSLFHYLGDFERVAPLLFGANKALRDRLAVRIASDVAIYNSRLKERFKGTEYEQAARRFLADADPAGAADGILREGTQISEASLELGLSSFGVSDLVSAVEMLVDAEVRLEHLRATGRSVEESVRELAVITYAEGLTWLRHQIFAV